MTTSLDATVLIDVLNGRSERVRTLFGQGKAAGAPWVISTIAYHEVLFGAEIRGQRAKERGLLKQLFGDCPIVPFTEAHAEETTTLRYELRRKGTPNDGLDILIAGQARAEGWAVATANLKDFNRMPNLVVEDWSA